MSDNPKPISDAELVGMMQRNQKALCEQIATLEAELAKLRAGQEPLAYITGYHGGRCIIEPVNRAAVLPSGMALYTTPQPSAAQGVNQQLLHALGEISWSNDSQWQADRARAAIAKAGGES